MTTRTLQTRLPAHNAKFSLHHLFKDHTSKLDPDPQAPARRMTQASARLLGFMIKLGQERAASDMRPQVLLSAPLSPQ
jgi:hypothetical protein